MLVSFVLVGVLFPGRKGKEREKGGLGSSYPAFFFFFLCPFLFCWLGLSLDLCWVLTNPVMAVSFAIVSFNYQVLFESLFVSFFLSFLSFVFVFCLSFGR